MEHHVGQGIAHRDGAYGAVHHTGAAMPAFIWIANLHNGFFLLCLAEDVHTANIRADAAGDTGVAVDDRGHITHFFPIE